MNWSGGTTSTPGSPVVRLCKLVIYHLPFVIYHLKTSGVREAEMSAMTNEKMSNDI